MSITEKSYLRSIFSGTKLRAQYEEVAKQA